MEAKPFSLQSPEKVAEAYGGNKQKIAQAIQMGALDPTSGLLAGMFIDRMRSAQAMEQAPQQTVAQQVLAPSAPPAPPAGLGAIGPQGGAMPPVPPPPPAGLGAMPPVGMAAGGMTELPASYGLDSLPIPDNMYDEQSFAGGGIVAFADGRKVDAKAERRKALMSVITNPDVSVEDRTAARVELNKLEGMGPGRTPGPGLADALAFTREDLNNLIPQAEASIYSPAAGGFKGGDLSVYAPDAPPRAADSIYSPSGTGSAKGISLSDLSRLVPRSPQIADDSIYSPGGGDVDFSGVMGDPAVFRREMAKMREPVASFSSRVKPSKPEEYVEMGSPYSPGSSTSYTRPLFSGSNKYEVPEGQKSRPAWHGAGRRAINAVADAPLRMPRGLNELDPEGNLSPLAGGLVTGTVGAVDLARDAGIIGARSIRGTAGAAKDIAGGIYDFAFTPRGKRSASPAPSNAKSDLGRVNMGGYDPNRSSPEAQLAAILGRSPTPEATELDALLGRTETAPVRADTAPTRIPGAGRRTGAGAATTRPTSSTAPAAGTTPEMSDEEFKAKARRDYEEAAKLPAPKGTTAEEKAARKNEDLWSALAQIGFGMAAGESPNFLTNVGKATAAAVPGMQESLKERRADTKEELKQRYAYELAQAGVKGDAYKFSMDRFDKLEDNRQRKATLAETIRHNQRVEELQGQQIAATGAAADKLTGTERMVRLIAAGNAPGATDEAKQLGQAATLAIRGYGEKTAYGNLADKANDNVEKLLTNPMSPEARKMRGLKKDPEAAERYRAELFEQQMGALQRTEGGAGNGRAKPGWSLLPEPQS